MYFIQGWSLLATIGLLFAHPVLGEAQALARPQPSALWAAPPTHNYGASASVGGRSPSAKQRGFLIGAIIGGVAAGFLGNKACRAFSAYTSDGCVGDTLWWATIGGMLGGLIGATGSGESDH